MATHPSILALEIPWTEEPGGLRSMGSKRVRRGWLMEHRHMIMMVKRDWNFSWGHWKVHRYYSRESRAVERIHSSGQVVSMCVNECVFVRQHVWGSVFVRSEGVCAWVCEWLNSAWERVEHECVSVCVRARECTWVCVWESVGWWEYVCECDHMSVCECVWEGVFLCESECMCLHLALEVLVIVVPCRCNKMSCMQWLETTQTYYLLFLKVNDLKSRCSFWRLW